MDGWMDGGMCLLRQEDSPHSSDEKPEEREATCMRSQKPPTSSPAWLAASAQFPTHSKWVVGVWVWGGGDGCYSLSSGATAPILPPHEGLDNLHIIEVKHTGGSPC